MTAEALALPRLVADFEDISLHKKPLLYPGDRPSGSFVTDGSMVHEVMVDRCSDGLEFGVRSGDGPDDYEDLDGVLRRAGLPDMGQRIPVIAYGANGSPTSLAGKLDKTDGHRPDLMVVPTVSAVMPGHDAVWSGWPGMKGNFTANMYSGPETAETQLKVGLNFLTPEQLTILNATELNYVLVRRSVIAGGQEIPAYMYAGKSTLHIRDGRPVALATAQAEDRRLESATAEAMLAAALGHAAVQSMLRANYGDRLAEDENPVTPERYVQLIRGLRMTEEQRRPRAVLKERMAACLSELRLVLTIDSSQADETVYDYDKAAALPSYDMARRGDMPDTPPAVENVLPAEGWPSSAHETREKIIKNVSEHKERIRKTYAGNPAGIR